ncbi:hypothetical protein MH050_15915 [Bacillus licheniformis]|uniref:hypothetical protein n=1 Tax=Bacillus licheniformis TaxID=1402 RepID=UPI0011BFBDF8|nr:hypothetical protein [Bacillus licheniformis]MCA1184666.1 hypothetical protein [Bacillus licheniformis]MCY7742301.1 hypothetical protein [Bacillus licheniformis]TWK89862.1 hypothetical protein CHCC20327_0114 [Bacillus licheniformis]
MDPKQIDSVLPLVESALKNGGRIGIDYHCKNEEAALQKVQDAAEKLNTKINQHSYNNCFWYVTEINREIQVAAFYPSAYEQKSRLGKGD